MSNLRIAPFTISCGTPFRLFRFVQEKTLIVVGAVLPHYDPVPIRAAAFEYFNHAG